ncbi:MAG: 3,4-dihydroxy-2-butanone 4-phosphate synthase/GTP cyclohydrolase [Candidatus Sulfotelmatobacter sp.]|nr:3,4-dihydroxy-2-butanone 4-phosphate synthase/GTP cyclohydrolase [Candidatus Sulfotelmatobacter sp.]
MFSQRPGAVDLLISSEASRVSGGDERCLVTQTVKFAEIEKSLRELRSGRMIVIADDEDRENEGDLVIAAEMVTPEVINFMATHARGLICLAMTGERLDQLELGPMVLNNTANLGTAFTVSIDARGRGVTTGISSYDRAQTILTAVDHRTRPEDLARPGHVFPLRARPDGVLERRGQTEASVDLARLAGLHHAAVICEIMNRNGSMARGSDLARFCSAYGLTMVTVAEVVRYRLETELRQSPGLHPSGTYGHAQEREKLLEEDTMNGNSLTGGWQ